MEGSDGEALKVQALGKSFRGRPAVEGLDLRVDKGVLYGLLGPDGSGKTTLLRMLAGVLVPDHGRGHILGHDFPGQVEKAKPELGYMPQRFGLYGDLSVWENLLFYARIHQVKEEGRKERMEELLSFSDLLPFKHRLARNLSGGMKQKLGLACALIHQPRLLLLDEPTTGVDPVSRREFWGILARLIAQGVTMVVATTYLDEAERCHQVGLLHKGRLVREGSPEQLKAALKEAMWEVLCRPQARARQVLLEMPGVRDAVRFGDSIHVALDPDQAEAEALWNRLRELGLDLERARPVEPTLEDVYILTVSRHGQA